MAFETTEQFHAAMIETARASEVLLADIRESVAAMRAWVEAGGFNALQAKNGHAAQLPLGASTNGHTPAPVPAPDVDVHGNPKVDCIRFEDRRSPAYTVRPTLPGGQRPYVAVPTGEYGIPDAYRYACIALLAYMAHTDGEREKHLARLPKKLRMKVEISLMQAAPR